MGYYILMINQFPKSKTLSMRERFPPTVFVDGQAKQQLAEGQASPKANILL